MSRRTHSRASSERRGRDVLLGLLLVGVVLTIYGQVWNHEFLIYDDDAYVVNNPVVNRGLTWEGIRWAFTGSHASNWHPLTWLSHMIDCRLFGLEPGPHHMINVLLHALNALLLFTALRIMTRAAQPSAVVALLFAVHPLHVQSVAWVAERKDLLAGSFWMLTILAYARFARKPGFRNYLLVFTSLALGLMAKPMLVTLPCVLLLLDVWPLRRWRGSGDGDVPTRPASRLILEKLPLAALSIASSLITVTSQEGGGSVIARDALPLLVRVENAAVSYVTYLWKSIWPAGLAVHYPHPGSDSTQASWLAAAALGSALVLGMVTMLVLRSTGRRYLAVGWLWYLGTLLPVIGLVQVGWQARADRYTYLPLIGIYLLVVWGGSEFASRSSSARIVVTVTTTLALVALATTTWLEIRYWRDSPTLFERALQVTRNNEVAHNNLGNWLILEGRFDEGVEHLEQALRLLPDSPLVLGGLGEAMIKQGRLVEAVRPLSRAVEVQPSFIAARRNLAYALVDLGRLDEAAEHFTTLIAQHPGDALTHHKLGQIRLRQRRLVEAAAHFAEAVRLDPDSPELRSELGVALFMQGRIEESVAEFRRALDLQPDYFLAHHRLGIVLLATDRPTEAVASFRAAIAGDPEFAPAYQSLASALRALGDEEGARAAEGRYRALTRRP